jgi:tellurite resistance protein
MWCKVAWADGVIENTERQKLAELWQQLGDGAVSRAEISQWLDEGVPFEPASVSDAVRSLFVQKALELARSDGEVMPDEVQTIRELREAFFEAAQTGGEQE